MRKVISLLALSALLFSESLAADTGKASKKPELPKSGILSSTGDAGYSQRSMSGPWADPLGAGSAPVAGSCSRSGRTDWLMKVVNSSKSEYSVNLQVALRDAAGKKLKSENFSYRLRAGAQEERKIYGLPGAMTCDLALLSWKKKEVKDAKAAEENKTAESSSEEG